MLDTTFYEVSFEEPVLRRDLAATCRLFGLYRLAHIDDGRITVRMPGGVLAKPDDVAFGDMRASDAVFVADGQDSDPEARVDADTLAAHRAILAARPEIMVVIEVTGGAAAAVACGPEGLLPISQNACLLQHQVAYHGYEGLALNHDERERLVADLGDKPLMLLRNHGTLAVGNTAAEAWVGIFFLERACAQQVAALSAGRDNVLIAPDAAQAETKEQGRGIGFISSLAWPGALRQLQRKSPGYDI